jgi:ligand-binding SRPBCC domain-containing protein
VNIPESPETFTCTIKHISPSRGLLVAEQILPVSRGKAFSFFEDPGNLPEITPQSLDFQILSAESSREVCINAEYMYKIKWLGLRMKWQSRIVDYQPPHKFIDIQVKGPYRSWVHTHVMEEVAGATRMKDFVAYTIPFFALPVHNLIIKKQLMEIFHYRAVRIVQWATKNS